LSLGPPQANREGDCRHHEASDNQTRAQEEPPDAWAGARRHEDQQVTVAISDWMRRLGAK
jgi:hypothetical protein